MVLGYMLLIRKRKKIGFPGIHPFGSGKFVCFVSLWEFWKWTDLNLFFSFRAPIHSLKFILLRRTLKKPLLNSKRWHVSQYCRDGKITVVSAGVSVARAIGTGKWHSLFSDICNMSKFSTSWLVKILLQSSVPSLFAGKRRLKAGQR